METVSGMCNNVAFFDCQVGGCGAKCIQNHAMILSKLFRLHVNAKNNAEQLLVRVVAVVLHHLQRCHGS